MKNSITKYDRQVPRYTSYPTAPHFHDGVNQAVFKKYLSKLPQNEAISLYMHIPFCREMCHYCGCNTKITKRYKPVEKYVAMLIREIETVSEIIDFKADVAHIHFGGGTPNYLEAEDFIAIMAKIRQYFNVVDGAEIAVEMDPRVLNKSKAEGFKITGVNRASFGVQDFNNQVQVAINRVQPYDIVKKSVDLLRENGINKINFDLIYGLPYQAVEGVIDNIKKSIELNPDRISFFGYAHVPWMKKHMQLIPEEALPDADLRAEMFEKSQEYMLNNGFIAIGLDHFVKAKDDMAVALKNNSLNRNFQGYTTDNHKTLIGLGVSAISSLPFGYFQNKTTVGQYEESVEEWGVATARGVEFQGEDKMRKEIIETLMCNMAIDLAEICNKYQLDGDYFTQELAEIAPLAADDLIHIADNKITIKDDANQVVRIVCSYFDQYFDINEAKHSQVV